MTIWGSATVVTVNCMCHARMESLTRAAKVTALKAVFLSEWPVDKYCVFTSVFQENKIQFGQVLFFPHLEKGTCVRSWQQNKV